jgi:hypothetical protein
VSIWSTFFDLEDDPQYRYEGSHVLPREDGPRDDADLAVSLAQVPSHITRDGRDDQPEDGAPWPWLRLSVGMSDALMHRPQVQELHAALGLWLERTEASR